MREGAPVRRNVLVWGTSKKAPACRFWHARLPALHHVAIFDEATGLLHRTGGLTTTLSRQHWRCPSSRRCPSHRRQPPHRARPVTSLPGTGVTNPACRRHTLLCQLSVPRRHPQLSKAWPGVAGLKEEEKIVVISSVNSLGTEEPSNGDAYQRTSSASMPSFSARC